MTRHNRVLNSAANIAEKAVVGLFRWAATDHINKGRPIQFIPGTTFLGSLGYILFELFLGIFTAVLTGAIAYVMIVYGLLHQSVSKSILWLSHVFAMAELIANAWLSHGCRDVVDLRRALRSVAVGA